ncbi:MAG: pentapeptide repeat-containing protein, partial [Proteobacteria bacterium]|nr:pentapeptide repeat-containing protein [Pseudomonadota bacterium]
QLGSEKMAIRLGGIYALERIANDSDKDYWPIMETLTAFVRDNARWREQTQDETGKTAREEAAVQEPLTPEDAAGAATPGQETTTPAPPAIPKPVTDIQAILTVLGRRKYRSGQKEEKGWLDLRNTNLRGADLTGAHLEEVNLRGVHLKGARLEGAHLEGANLEEAHLEWAFLGGAHLEEAILEGAHLEGASLTGARLEGAYLTEAHLEVPTSREPTWRGPT